MSAEILTLSDLVRPPAGRLPAAVEASPHEEEWRFGPFRLLPARHLLMEGERPIRLGSRALEILIALAEHPGQLVGKDELIQRVWPDTYVEEANLRVHIAALRRALGDGQGGQHYLANVPGRGYRFVGEITQAEAIEIVVSPSQPVVHNLPAPLQRMIGREDVVATLVASIERRRFVSVVGPGGIGKTTVAIAAADQLVHAGTSVLLVDIAPLAEPGMIAAALGTVLGLAVNSSDPLPGIVSYLAQRHVVIVLDSCERAIDEAAALAEAVLAGAPEVHILATSREPLRAEGEHVQRLAPLAVPAATDVLSARDALEHSAVRLFVERAAASLDGFVLNDTNAPVVAEICRRLDGIPLAIELAAGRIDAFGLKGVANLLDDRFQLLTRGRRTALPRHKTLAATLDWSYGALTDRERSALRQLAVFPGSFDLAAASAVLDGECGQSAVECLADLVGRSLLSVDASTTVVRYRLGETTRAYARGKLVEANEVADAQRRHAAFMLAAVGTEGRTIEVLPPAAAQSRMDDVRSALDWAFSDGGEAEAGIQISAAAIPLWMHASLIQECVTRTGRAIEALPGTSLVGTAPEMQLQCARGLALMFTKGSVSETVAALSRSLEIARHLDDNEYAMRALWGLWVGRLNNGSIRESLSFARAFAERALASPDPLDAAIGDRMVGFSLHFLGQQAEARVSIERMLDRDGGDRRQSHAVRFQFDQWTTARAALAEVLWLQGFADQAMIAAEQSVVDASGKGHALTYCNTLAKSAAVALLAGDHDTAARMITTLLVEASAHGLAFWKAEGGCLMGILMMRSGRHAAGLARLREEIHGFPGSTLTVRYIAFIGELADGLSIAGDHAGARATIATALERCSRNEEHWCISELLRINAMIELYEGAADAEAEAEALFAQSLDWARRQGALAWELRTATNLAELRRRQGRSAEGRALLEAVYDRFTEGYRTPDLVAARTLLETLTDD